MTHDNHAAQDQPQISLRYSSTTDGSDGAASVESAAQHRVSPFLPPARPSTSKPYNASFMFFSQIPRCPHARFRSQCSSASKQAWRNLA